jgi:hypothetical protein
MPHSTICIQGPELQLKGVRMYQRAALSFDIIVHVLLLDAFTFPTDSSLLISGVGRDFQDRPFAVWMTWAANGFLAVRVVTFFLNSMSCIHACMYRIA